ncbi:MAG TPA: PTS sugar transporter subunit IIA [Tepidisphaeraceae bacterium]|nr:PTS sugar transporter subunit IIA [Tepidisphaeraceae bacterium]
MRLTEILKPVNIKVPLSAKTKVEAISELVDLLSANGELTDPKMVLDAVLDREATRTTGIGKGLAIPHGKCGGTNHLVMAIGKPAEPIEFQAIDGRPITVLWMLTSPPEMTTLHIQALARISRLMLIDAFRMAINSAGTPDEIFNLVVEQEKLM